MLFRRRREDAALAGIAVLGLLVSTGWLWVHSAAVQPVLETSTEVPLGTVRALGDARRRDATNPSWAPLPDGASVFANDALFTPPHTTLLIEFQSGARVEMAARTLLVLSDPGEAQSERLRIERGFVSGTSSEAPLTIEGRFGQLTLAPRGELNVLLGASTRIESIRGTTALAGKSTLELNAGDVAQGTQNELSAERHALSVLAAPTPARTFTDRFPARIALELAAPDGSRLEWSDEPTLEDAQSTPIRAGGAEIFANQPGLYWLRIVDPSGARSQRLTHVVLHSDPPTLVYPDADATVLAPPEHALSFQWNPIEGCGRYRIQVGTDTQLNTVLIDDVVSSPRWLGQRPIDEGELYWRVAACPEESDPPRFAELQSFRLIQKPILASPKPIPSVIQRATNE